MIRNLSFGLGRKSNYIFNVIGSIELFNVCLCLIILVINKGVILYEALLSIVIMML